MPPAPKRLTITARAGKTHVAFLRRHLSKAIAQVSAAPAVVEMTLVGDALMSQLHQQFLGIAGPTDVLTFELDHDTRGRCVSGEVIVCVPEARRQARLRKIPTRHELLLYAIHGLLHLSGYDDRTEQAYRKMHRTEDTILTQLGVGPVFGLDAHSKRARPPTRSSRRSALGRRSITESGAA